MGEQGLLCRYVGPVVVDYGNLVEITAAAHLLMGATDISDLSFSSPQTPGAEGGPFVAGGGSDPGSAGGLLSSGGTSGGGTSGSGASGGGTASGGHLPFTGLAAGAVAAIGSALAAGGTALRRATRRRQP